MSKRLKDILERTAATAAEAGLAYGIVELSSIKAAWAVPIAGVLAYAKSLLAKYVGNPDSASLTKVV